MSRDPREAWQKLQQSLINAQKSGRGGFPGGGSPRGALGGAAGLILLAGGVYAANNALFNGMLN
jgi:prohibitin 2